MEVLHDWKFWGFAITNLITLTGFLVIKFNDFRHLEDDVKEIKNTQNDQQKSINNIDKNLAVLEQRTTNLEKSKK